MNLGEKPVAEAGISYATAVAKIIGLGLLAMIPWWKGRGSARRSCKLAGSPS